VTTEPSRATEPEGFLAWSQRAARIASDKLGRHTIILDVGEVLAVTDLFVITSGSNARHVRTLVEAIEVEVVAVGGPSPRSVEGRDTHQWVLMDYGPFVVHVFDEERRAYYDLERLWSDRPVVAWQES
jgi:ribosome-associated protein